MKVVRTIAELKKERRGNIGFVPTMGAFHEGHLELMRVALRTTDQVIVSLFVNPTQFAPTEDLSRYPRNEQRDIELAESVGVDILFAPSVEEMYSSKATSVLVRDVTDLFEGEFRPGHFEGVATVVNKLFNIVEPSVALFGWKDFQQCVVLQRMVRDLFMPLRLEFVETVRESDGLAMSSRNVYLSTEGRKIAGILNKVLHHASLEIVQTPTQIECIVQASISELTQSGFIVDYLALVDIETVKRVDNLDQPCRLIACARIEGVRLLDNVPVNS